ncbi:37523_t:CDS:1, partial [Gigaspora margarita]
MKKLFTQVLKNLVWYYNSKLAWVIPEEVPNQTESSSTRNHNGEEGSYRKLNKQKGLEISGKENRSVVSYSYKNTNNGNFSSEGIYYRELAGSSKASRSTRRESWSRGPSKERYNKCYSDE